MKKQLARLTLIFAFFTCTAPAFSTEPKVKIRDTFLTMKDGIKLSATIYEPSNIDKNVKLPVLLELLPYRKDDSFYARDYPLHTYFAEHGFISVKVDIRGTGSSQGKLPEREYSDEEINDAIEIIDQISKLPNSNSNVGMWGISWGGFNAVMTGMKRPPALKAILAAHVSDDIYHDDVHYSDGCLHFDWYNLEIDHENGLPPSPKYELDTEYLKNRFEAYPWVLTYLKQQRNGDFYRKKSLRYQTEKLNIPCYIIGGLLDGYRDTPIRMLEYLKAPIKVEIGPWNHSWPDNGTPGPNYEWRANACKFFKHWLTDQKNDCMQSNFLVFVRTGNGPDIQLKQTPGYWRYCNWPIEQLGKIYFPQSNKLLNHSFEQTIDSETLANVATRGYQAGYWWGEPTGDMRSDDAYSFTFDTIKLDEKVEIIGNPKITLEVSCTAPQATFSARLEDVFPDGRVSLVTGGLLNASHRKSSEKPEYLIPGQKYKLEIPMHFTTWTFKPGHKIRLAISNSQFPMAWPSPEKLSSTIYFGPNTTLTLPETKTDRRLVRLPIPENRISRYEGENSPEVNYSVIEEGPEEHKVIWKQVSHGAHWVKDKGRNDVFDISRYVNHVAHDNQPERAGFKGRMNTEISSFKSLKSKIDLTTEIEIVSDQDYFNAKVTRILNSLGKTIAKKTWTEKIKRDFQ